MVMNGERLARLRTDLADWRIWYSERSAHYHAYRQGGFTERDGDPRRFHVAATTPDRLAALLLAQTLLDTKGPAMDHPNPVASWSAHHIPAGTPIRYIVNATDDEAQIRLLFGPSDQVELELPLSVIPPMLTTLRDAEREAQGSR